MLRSHPTPAPESEDEHELRRIDSPSGRHIELKGSQSARNGLGTGDDSMRVIDRLHLGADI